MGERLEMEWICVNKMEFFLFGGPHGREPSQSRINICCGCTPMFDGVFHCGRLSDIYILEFWLSTADDSRRRTNCELKWQPAVVRNNHFPV